MRYQIVIEGTNEEQVRKLFEEVQNEYSLFDNCVLQEVNDEDTILDDDRAEETGVLDCEYPSEKTYEEKQAFLENKKEDLTIELGDIEHELNELEE